MAFQNDAAPRTLIFKNASDFIGVLVQNRSVRRNDKNTVSPVFLSLYEGKAQRCKRFIRSRFGVSEEVRLGRISIQRPTLEGISVSLRFQCREILFKRVSFLDLN